MKLAEFCTKKLLLEAAKVCDWYKNPVGQKACFVLDHIVKTTVSPTHKALYSVVTDDLMSWGVGRAVWFPRCGNISGGARFGRVTKELVRNYAEGQRISNPGKRREGRLGSEETRADYPVLYRLRWVPHNGRKSSGLFREDMTYVITNALPGFGEGINPRSSLHG